MKYLAFAATEFSRPEAAYWQVPLHDSALVRGRTVLDFLLHKPGNAKSFSIHHFIDDDRELPECESASRWVGFISERLAHLGEPREPKDDFDRWPDRKPGEDKGDDRLERLARLTIAVLRWRTAQVRADCQPILELISRRAEEYLDDPSETRFHAMDPLNL